MHEAVPPPGVVDEADRPPDRNRLRLGKKRVNELLERIGHHDGIGIDGADELTQRDVERRVQGVGLATVPLLRHHQSGILR